MESITMDLKDFMRQKRAEMPKAANALDLEYITADEYAERMKMTKNMVLSRLRKGAIPNAVKDGKRWVIGIEPTFSREEYDKVKLENAELKATLNILKTILVERV